MDSMTLGHVFIRVLQFPPVSVIPPLLRIHSRIVRGMDKGPLAVQFHRSTNSLYRNRKGESEGRDCIHMGRVAPRAPVNRDLKAGTLTQLYVTWMKGYKSFKLSFSLWPLCTLDNTLVVWQCSMWNDARYVQWIQVGKYFGKQSLWRWTLRR
jgi:hypothetical protein